MQFDWYAALVERLEGETEPSQENEEPASSIWETIEQRIQIAEFNPKASPSVIVRELKDRQGVYFVLKNTEEKTYLRLSLEEHSLWVQMDGQTSVRDLIVNHFEDTGKFAHAMVVHLVEQLLLKNMLTEKRVAVWTQLNQVVYAGWSNTSV